MSQQPQKRFVRMLFRPATWKDTICPGMIFTAKQAGNKLTGADAHAWVEVYFDGVGWLPLDVTPGYYYDAVSLQQMIGMPEQASKNAALEDPSFEANQVASGYSLPWDSGDRKNPGL